MSLFNIFRRDKEESKPAAPAPVAPPVRQTLPVAPIAPPPPASRIPEPPAPPPPSSVAPDMDLDRIRGELMEIAKIVGSEDSSATQAGAAEQGVRVQLPLIEVMKLVPHAFRQIGNPPPDSKISIVIPDLFDQLTKGKVTVRLSSLIAGVAMDVRSAEATMHGDEPVSLPLPLVVSAINPTELKLRTAKQEIDRGESLLPNLFTPGSLRKPVAPAAPTPAAAPPPPVRPTPPVGLPPSPVAPTVPPATPSFNRPVPPVLQPAPQAPVAPPPSSVTLPKPAAPVSAGPSQLKTEPSVQLPGTSVSQPKPAPVFAPPPAPPPPAAVVSPKAPDTVAPPLPVAPPPPVAAVPAPVLPATPVAAPVPPPPQPVAPPPSVAAPVPPAPVSPPPAVAPQPAPAVAEAPVLSRSEIEAADAKEQKAAMEAAIEEEAAREHGLLLYGVDLNNTTAEEMVTRFNGVGRKLAEKIVANRIENGPFKDVYDLARVPGVKGKVFQRITGMVWPAQLFRHREQVATLIGVVGNEIPDVRGVAQRFKEIEGFTGCIMIDQDGLTLASTWEHPSAEALGAFAPQMFKKLSRYVKQLKMGNIRTLTFFTDDQPVTLVSSGAILFVAVHKSSRFSKRQVELIQALATELGRKLQR